MVSLEGSLVPKLADTDTNVTMMPGNSLSFARLNRHCNGHPITDMNCCSAERPCSIGEGDCDYDRDCQRGLKCGFDNCYVDFATPYGYNWEIMADCCFGINFQKLEY